jgi:hypothetical protein
MKTLTQRRGERRENAEPDYQAEMKLPAGKTCASCFAVRFCIGIVGIGCTRCRRRGRRSR